MSEAAVERDLVGAVARGLAERFALLVRSADRLDALDGRTTVLTSDELRADASARIDAAHELVARLLRAAADPVLAELARSLARRSPQRAADLADLMGTARSVVGWRVSDLVDAGMAERDLGPDTVSATPLGAAVVDLIGQLESETERRIRERLAAATTT